MRNDEDEDQGPPQGPPGPEAMIPKMQLLMEGVVVFMGDVFCGILCQAYCLDGLELVYHSY